MDILDALERKVTELLDEIAALRKRNAELEVGLAAGRDNGAEIARLEEALRQERELREDVLKRVSTLVRRLDEQDSTG